MSKDKFRIAADVSSQVREELLRRFPPRFAQVFARSITLAYGVSGDLWGDDELGNVEIFVYGYHEGISTDVLLVSVEALGGRYRPDGKMFHLTMSTEQGVPPVAAGEQIKMDHAQLGIEPVYFDVTFFKFPLWKMKFEKRAA